MTESIVVGINASTPSRSALIWSVRRALSTGASVELLHVIDSVDTDRAGAALLLQQELDFARTIAPELQITTNLADGPAEEALARRSANHTMLVVGTHKTGFIYGQTFGSRFLELAWRAHCHVAFIPDQAGSTRHGVVAAADGSPTGAAIIRFAADEAVASGQDLTLVGASRSESHEGSAVALDAQHELRVFSRVSGLPRAQALIAASTGASLLVVGRPRRPWSSTLGRSANHDVLLNMSCPVVVVCAG
jgi:nucleotide-binding universal stress UspA family protein